jgi:hypothetical protein
MTRRSATAWFITNLVLCLSLFLIYTNTQRLKQQADHLCFVSNAMEQVLAAAAHQTQDRLRNHAYGKNQRDAQNSLFVYKQTIRLLHDHSDKCRRS